MRRFFKFNVNNFTILFSIGCFCLILPSSFSEQNDSVKFIKDNPNLKNKNQLDNILLPMPNGDYNSSYLKVVKGRNPFNEISSSDSEDIDNVYELITFKGVAKSKDIEYAIIESNKIQRFYTIGDALDNGFIIKSISIKNITVDITNGLKDYRLSLTSILKQK